MNPKTIKKLELDKILAALAGYAAFSASRELLEELEPTSNRDLAQRWLDETSEARLLVEEHPDVSVGASRDVRPHARHAERGIILNPGQLLEVASTLRAGRILRKKLSEIELVPLLNEYAQALFESRSLENAIGNAISDIGDVMDSASPELASIRRDLRIAHERLQSKLQSIVNNSQNAPYLQEALVTMRGGRYVIPVRAEARGRIKGIVHDQSSSGATLFIEPIATVEINNQIRELELREQEEIDRILAELTEMVADEGEPIVWMVDALAAIDGALAKAKYAAQLNAHEPTLAGVEESSIVLHQARHPLLDPQEVVPINVELEPETHILIITGPNTGGKTVSLKTVGLLILMAQCGLHIPATKGSVVPVFSQVFADIGDEQSIEQSLSTFSAHLTNIVTILDQADEESLVLFDELGSGTDPTEGAAIARAIIDDLLSRRITALIATHYPELKLYAHSTEGVRNASVEFDIETLAPTYRLIIGLPGRSNALAIATRLGLREDIIEAARGFVGQDDLSADDLLDEIHRTREELLESQARLDAAETDAIALRNDLMWRLEGIEAERDDILKEAYAEVEGELEQLRSKVVELRRTLTTLSPTQKMNYGDATAALEEIDAQAEALTSTAGELRQRRAVKPPPPPPPPAKVPEPRTPQVGDRVFVASLNSEGEIVDIDDGDDVEVQVGSLRLRVQIKDVEWRGSKPTPNRHEEQYVKGPRPESPGLELHLRGFMVDDAVPMVEDYIDRAYLAGLPWVRIIHGKGTGALRKAVRDLLKNHPLVQTYQKAPEKEGGDGATVVYLSSKT